MDFDQNLETKNQTDYKINFFQAFIAQWLERWSSKPEAGSSILPEGK